MTVSLAGKKVMVTGASSGIGRAVSVSLVEEGAEVLGVCRRADEVAAGVRGVCCDLCREGEIERVFGEVDQLDVLVNNAGVAYLSRLTDGDPADWEAMWRVNVMALARCSQLALGLFPEGGGQIVNVSSMSGHRVPPTGGFYAPTKYAVRGVTESLRNELRAEGSGTRVASVSPGFVDTPLLDHYFRGREEDLEKTRGGMKMLTAEDVAECVLGILKTPCHVEVGDVQVRSVDQVG